MTSHVQVFVDTSHLIGVEFDHDQWHRVALLAADVTADMQRVTSEGVFQELLAHFARADGGTRRSVAATVRDMRADARTIVVRHTPGLLAAALDLFDGEFRHTRLSYQDCIAIQIMRDFGITDILTADQEFALAGMTPLLRRYI